MKVVQRIVAAQAPAAVLLIRLMEGLVFLSEGIQKFLFPKLVGAGRFAQIGLPQPEFLALFVGTFEIVCGLLTRFAVIPTITIILVAILTTKIPMLADGGFWKLAHEGRTDFCMLMGLLFLLIVGAGQFSLDAFIGGRVGSDFGQPGIRK